LIWINKIAGDGLSPELTGNNSDPLFLNAGIDRISFGFPEKKCHEGIIPGK
jgi:hypothetical protein